MVEAGGADGRTTLVSDALSGLRTTRVVPGWDSIGLDGSYMVCRGRIKRGKRLKAAENMGSSRLIGEVEERVDRWHRITLGRSRKNDSAWGSWPLHSLGDGYGVSADLAALATRTVGPGEWRKGTVISMPNVPCLVAKVRKGEVVAIIAPCRVRP
jgi:hypothetical protein